MAQVEATAASFLEGQGIPVDLHDIETELVKLWGTAAGQTGGLELETPPVTRIVLANLVVEVLDREAECLARCWKRSSSGIRAGQSWCVGRAIGSEG